MSTGSCLPSGSNSPSSTPTCATKSLGKQLPVDIGELAQFLVQIALALGGIGVEEQRKSLKPDAQIGAVFGGPKAFCGKCRCPARGGKRMRTRERLEFVAAARRHRYHELGGFQVGGVFGIEPVMSVAGDERRSGGACLWRSPTGLRHWAGDAGATGRRGLAPAQGRGDASNRRR